ncbi:MAG: UDP-N-acetylmuramate--L-alanine ligase [Planctomycetota bacterium]|nr:UDP-N-acetylmuramate--L-alanine ligase [Planctomycetota bacterium]
MMIARDHLDLSEPRRLHLLGIGGSGMAPLARLLRGAGHTVSGADACLNENAAALRSAGVPVLTGAEANLLPASLDGVVFTAALPADAPPLVEARRLELPVIKYARAVGLLSARKRTFAVAGTHGKTTTTAMLAYVFERAGLAPSFLVGGKVPQLAGDGRGASDRLVVEACEYDRSFLHLDPAVAIVTNMEADHLDYYRDIVEIRDAFREFARRVSELLIVPESLREEIGRAGGVRARVVTFGEHAGADVAIDGPPWTLNGVPVRPGIPGRHNAWNAAAVWAAARAEGLARDVVVDALSAFRGVGRRLQVVGRPRGVCVIDDYAHHPTEVVAGLEALREAYTPRRLWVVFQPHQYSRLRRFLPAFADALTAADRIVIPSVFAARDAEEDRVSVSSSDLVDAVKHRGGDAVHMPDFSSIVDFVRTQARAGDVVVTMGAGDVGDVAGRIAATL